MPLDACTIVFARDHHATVRITCPQHLTPSVMGIPSRYRVHIYCGKTRVAGLQSGEGSMLIDSVVWAQFVNVTDTQPHKQPRRHNKFRTNALRREAKNVRLLLHRQCIRRFTPPQKVTHPTTNQAWRLFTRWIENTLTHYAKPLT